MKLGEISDKNRKARKKVDASHRRRSDLRWLADANLALPKAKSPAGLDSPRLVRGSRTDVAEHEIEEKKEDRELIKEITSNYILSLTGSPILPAFSRKMLFEFREVFDYQDSRVKKYLLFQGELKNRIQILTQIQKEFSFNRIEDVTEEKKKEIIIKMDGIIPFNEETLPLYRKNIKISQWQN